MKKSVALVCVGAFCSVSLLAQVSNGPQFVHIKEKPGVRVPSQPAPAGLKRIFSNLGKNNAAYNVTGGWTVSGPNSVANVSSFIALPFTPKSDSHVSQVRVAIGDIEIGANQVNVSIYGDASGSPGSLIAGPVTITNLPSVGTCCVVSEASFSPVAVTGGTQYWIVVDTPLSGTGSDFLGVWYGVAKPEFPLSVNGGELGWSRFNGDILPAGAVFGMIP